MSEVPSGHIGSWWGTVGARAASASPGRADEQAQRRLFSGYYWLFMSATEALSRPSVIPMLIWPLSFYGNR